MNYVYGPNNRLNVSVGASVFGTGVVDAFHTVGVEVVVPDGVNWQYDGLDGNPLNFRFENEAGAVPEPGSVGLALIGLASLAGAQWRRRRQAR